MGALHSKAGTLPRADTSTAVLNHFGAKGLAKASPCPRAGLVMFNGLLPPQAMGITAELI